MKSDPVLARRVMTWNNSGKNSCASSEEIGLKDRARTIRARVEISGQATFSGRVVDGLR